MHAMIVKMQVCVLLHTAYVLHSKYFFLLSHTPRKYMYYLDLHIIMLHVSLETITHFIAQS